MDENVIDDLREDLLAALDHHKPGRLVLDFQQVKALSSDGFRLHTANPLQVGWEVTLEAARQFPVKALICWACGQEAGGVFSEAVAL